MKNKTSVSSTKKTTKSAITKKVPTKKAVVRKAVSKKVTVRKSASKKSVRRTGVMAAKKSFADVVKKVEKKIDVSVSKKIDTKKAAKSIGKMERKIEKKIVKAAAPVKRAMNIKTAPSSKAKRNFSKKNDFRISTEFAIAVIFVVAGTFAYIFWKGYSNHSGMPSVSYNVSVDESGRTEMEMSKSDGWKTFRNDSIGGEFSLPKNWKMLEGGGKFISENSPEELVITPEKNDKEYDAEKLLEIAQEENEDANVALLPDSSGIKLEKRDGDIIRQTAKIFTSGYILTATYSTYGSEDAGLFFEEIVPTFKSI